ncbi:MAG: MgtC/SapB family protein [Oscillospiraceae bacterium]|nr:MgtC/SapB family protein [Oscillospiraceae bacterium]
MNWSALLLGELPLSANLDYCLRLLVSCVCGAAIGIERSRHFKEAGVRTHVIVCLGAALIMVVSKYGFVDLNFQNDNLFRGMRGTDPARLAAQVVSGISFLGAGVIFKREGLVRGLTTAAGIWITAAIGLAVGAGMILIGMFTTLVVCILQILMHKFIFGPDAYATNQLHFTVKNGHEFNHSLNEQLEKWNGTVMESSFSRNQEDGTTDYDLTVRRRKEISYAEMKEFIAAHDEIISCTNSSAKK